MNMFKKNGGFTLVELIVVIAILAILAAVAVPAYSGYINSANDVAVETELSAIKTAAMAANATVGAVTDITVDKDGNLTVNGKTEFDKSFADSFKQYFTTCTLTPKTTGEGTAAKTVYTISVNGFASNIANTSYSVDGAKWSTASGKWEPVTPKS